MVGIAALALGNSVIPLLLYQVRQVPFHQGSHGVAGATSVFSIIWLFCNLPQDQKDIRGI